MQVNPSSILIVVPARGGSKRLPGKNLMQVGGRTLVKRVADFLGGEGLLNSAILSTDDESIAEAGRRAGLSVPFLRPAELATDTATAVDVVRHALDWHEDQGNRPSFVAVIQVTAPFRRKRLLLDALSLLAEGPHVNSVVAMKKLGFSSQYVFRASTSGTAVPLGHDPAPAWVPTGALYVTRVTAFRKQNTLYAAPVASIETSDRVRRY